MPSKPITEGAVRGDIFKIPLDQVVIPPNPVREFDPPEDLFEQFYQSIKSEGQIVPALGRVLPDKRVVLLEGQQRWRALKRLEQETGEPQFIRVEIFRGNEEEAFDRSFIANKQRIPPTPVDDAKVARTYIDKFGKTLAQVAEKFGKSEAWVSQRLKLLDLGERDRLLAHTNFLKAESAILLAQMAPEKREETLAVAAQIESEKTGQEVVVPTAEALMERVRSTPDSKAAKKTAGSVSTTSLAQAAAQTGALGDRAPEMKMKEFKEFIQEMIDTEPGTRKEELGKAILGVITRKFGAQGFDNRVEPLLGMKPAGKVVEMGAKKAVARKQGK
jgi:ParB/RepB/Spo0J family partition protein